MADFFFLTRNRIKLKPFADCIRLCLPKTAASREGAAVLWMWKMRHVRGRRYWPLAGAIASVGAAILMASATVTSAQPPRPLSASDVQGCCVCRGTNGGDATTVRSCSDAVGVESCVSQCKGQDADSIAFGYQQTCSQGCAGFPTQNLH